LHLAERRAKELERKLEASEKAREEAETKAASVADLRDRLNATETALSEKEEQISKREAAIIARLETQSVRFSSNVPLSCHRPFFVCLYRLHVYIEKVPLFQQKKFVSCTPGTKIWKKTPSWIPSQYWR
jgi:DNA repair exonuclease SbcCD ATPase subunit